MVVSPTLRELLDAGVHFGHKTARWHPKMKPYIFMAKSGVHVINLEKTSEMLDKALAFAAELSKEGKKVIFVGTKKQASEIVRKAAESCGMPYVNFRWVGGTLTNFPNIKDSIARYKKEKAALAEENTKLNKKELSKLREVVEKGNKLFGGLVDLDKKPDALFLIGAHDEKNALREAKNENIPVIALVDTNSDPTVIDYPIPANDDATKSLELFAGVFSKTILQNKGLVKEEQK